MPVTLTARQRKDLRSRTGTLEYTASHRGRLYSNPTLVVERGERVRVRLANQLPESTIVHWHGLSVSAGNDGNGSVLAAPGEVYDYDFEIRNRSAMRGWRIKRNAKGPLGCAINWSQNRVKIS